MLNLPRVRGALRGSPLWHRAVLGEAPVSHVVFVPGEGKFVSDTFWRGPVGSTTWDLIPLSYR